MGIKELLQKFAKDKDFAAKYYAIHSIDAVLVEAKKDGYSITEEEFSEMLKALSNREITDAEAAEATGGYDAEYVRRLEEELKHLDTLENWLGYMFNHGSVQYIKETTKQRSATYEWRQELMGELERARSQ